MLLFLHQVIYYRYNPNSWRMHILNERVGIIYAAGSLCNDTSSKLLLVCCGSLVMFFLVLLIEVMLVVVILFW